MTFQMTMLAKLMGVEGIMGWGKVQIVLEASGLSMLDIDTCFFVWSSSNFIIGQNFHVGSDTAEAPLAQLTSKDLLHDINMSLRLTHFLEASSPRNANTN